MALSELLTNYCNQLLGENTESTSKTQNSKLFKKKKSAKLKREKLYNNFTENSFKVIGDGLPDFDILVNKAEKKRKSNLKSDNSEISNSGKSSNEVTDDGFKIIGEIPPDDSDVSDAFESDIDESEWISEAKQCQKKGGVTLQESELKTDKSLKIIKSNKSSNKITDDGFQIIEEIPPDDSDVSDAFESDLDESEWLHETKQRLIKTNKVLDSPSHCMKDKTNVLKCNFQNIKKPLLDLIHYFGMEEKFSQSNSERKTIINDKKNKILSSSELDIIDYSKKRGKKRKVVLKPQTETPNTTKKDNEVELKKARYEIFKFGTTAVSDNVERKNAKIDLVVKLGAKPPKNQAINYKALIEKRKEQKMKEKEKREEEREMGLPVKKVLVKTKHKQDVIDINPGIGTFKNGMLKLSKRDLETIKSS